MTLQAPAGLSSAAGNVAALLGEATADVSDATPSGPASSAFQYSWGCGGHGLRVPHQLPRALHRQRHLGHSADAVSTPL